MIDRWFGTAELIGYAEARLEPDSLSLTLLMMLVSMSCRLVSGQFVLNIFFLVMSWRKPNTLSRDIEYRLACAKYVTSAIMRRVPSCKPHS